VFKEKIRMFCWEKESKSLPDAKTEPWCLLPGGREKGLSNTADRGLDGRVDHSTSKWRAQGKRISHIDLNVKLCRALFHKYELEEI
jgi:hypothetical protein